MSPSALPPSLAEFHRHVVHDAELLERLAAAGDADAFVTLAVAAGAERGLVFSAADVRAALLAARRTWIERNVP
ncbi:Nif11 family protein [Opitutus terrae]|uniref:Aspartyl/asparaginyl beta-hydroxylase n=1 Tax=Opitutus terrae (strain DSM 11246 / JCM 15787 / PB90-1) TaxID=452637 RepID=B1ZP44_OPITP|nr:Nif11-like leader peptide family natural product precursor [Opitutus terrae]ACB77530.1 aspartyl/asparaginyl beta-hydroxylase [Opitutus terrae PB90-1]